MKEKIKKVAGIFAKREINKTKTQKNLHVVWSGVN